MRELNAVEEVGDRPADRVPVRRLVVAGPDQRLAQRLHSGGVGEFRQAGAAEQGAERRVAECGLVEFGEMGVAAASVQQQGVAEVVERRAALVGCQCADGGTGEILKTHDVSFARTLCRKSPPASDDRDNWSPAFHPEPASARKTVMKIGMKGWETQM
jgi:hypothetical protein